MILIIENADPGKGLRNNKIILDYWLPHAVTIQSYNNEKKPTLQPILAFTAVAASHGHVITIHILHKQLAISRVNREDGSKILITFKLPCIILAKGLLYQVHKNPITGWQERKTGRYHHHHHHHHHPHHPQQQQQQQQQPPPDFCSQYAGALMTKFPT
ncbi:uncharacterized protein PHA67_010883 isoform 1-T1 [Liasis olivaceus]